MRKTKYGRKWLTVLGLSGVILLWPPGGAQASGAEITEEMAVIGKEAQETEQTTGQNTGQTETGREEAGNVQRSKPPKQEKTQTDPGMSKSEAARAAGRNTEQEIKQEINRKADQKANQETDQETDQKSNQTVNQRIYQEEKTKTEQDTNEVKRQKEAKETDSVPDYAAKRRTTFHVPVEEGEMQKEREGAAAKDSVQDSEKETTGEEGKEAHVKQQESGRQTDSEILLLAVAAALLLAGIGRWMGHFLFHKW